VPSTPSKEYYLGVPLGIWLTSVVYSGSSSKILYEATLTIVQNI